MEQYSLQKLDSNTILLQGEKQIRLLRRTDSEHDFNLNFAHQSKKDQKIVLEFKKSEVEFLRKVGLNFKSEGEDAYYEHKLEEWIDYGTNIFHELDQRLKSREISEELLNRAYEILLTKFETIRHFAGNKQFIKSPSLEQNKEEAWGINKTIIPMPESPFTIPRSISLNNRPAFKYPYTIKSTFATDNYLLVLLDEVHRLCILNRESILFQVSEISLRKGLKKEYELIQYQKELEEVQNSNFNEPSIYKILKNCLKYADKVKPPEKLLKQLEEKKEEEVKKEK